MTEQIEFGEALRILKIVLQNAPSRGSSIFRTFRHLGVFGLFALAILDSSPLPTFGGPDILIAILVSVRSSPWYVYAIVATVGSTIGASITFHLARKAGETYVKSKFGEARASAFLGTFKKYGTGTLVASTAIPFPFPTSLMFAAAGVSDYEPGKFLTLVVVCRGVRYTVIGLVADVYGRQFTRILRHPMEHWGWLLLFTAVVCISIAAGVLFERRLTTPLAQ